MRDQKQELDQAERALLARFVALYLLKCVAFVAILGLLVWWLS